MARNKLMRTMVCLFAVLAPLVMSPAQEVHARSRSRSSSRSSSSSSRSRSWGKTSSTRTSSSSRYTSSARSRANSSSSSSSSRSFWSSRPSTTTTRSSVAPRPDSASDADQRAYFLSRSSNSFNRKSFKDTEQAKKAAVTDFKSKYGSQFPSKFEKEPISRPSYIPKKYYRPGDNRSVDVVYVADKGGYYYRDSRGDLVLYDVMRDPVVRNRVMYRYGYDYTGRTYVNTWSPWSYFMITLITLTFVVIVVMALYAIKNGMFG